MSTGTKHDSGKPPIHFLTREFLEGVAQAQAFGAKKYGDYNFCNGLNHLRLVDACLRHLTAYMWGEDLDPESGLPHVFLAGANLNMLSYMIKHHPELDDRYKELTKNSHTGSSFDDFLKQENIELDKDKFLKFKDKNESN